MTACSDLLKPGGYARFGQWLTNLEAEMEAAGAGSLAEFARNKLEWVEEAANESLVEHRYKKEAFPYGLPKIKDDLAFFDCVQAPCIAHCAVCQDVPEYAWAIKEGNYDQALEVILAAQSAARRDGLRLQPPVPDALHAERLRGDYCAFAR